MSCVQKKGFLDDIAHIILQKYKHLQKTKRSKDVWLKGKEKEAVQAFISSVFPPPGTRLILC